MADWQGTAHDRAVDFEVFKDRNRKVFERRPQVTITARGTFNLSRAAFEALGGPDFVELLYDPAERLIGFRPAVSEYAYAARRGKQFSVEGRAFLDHYGIPHETARRYDAEMLDDVLVIDLRTGGTPVTSPRKGTGRRLGDEG